MTTYQVAALDSDGCTVTSQEAYTLKAAKQTMKDIRSDASYGDDIVRIEVTEDTTGDVVIDWNHSR
jgi:hypothetical protein